MCIPYEKHRSVSVCENVKQNQVFFDFVSRFYLRKCISKIMIYVYYNVYLAFGDNYVEKY